MPKPNAISANSAKRSFQPAATVVIQTNQFHWREVESDDYRKYIANLRAIGCPEATIRDIILTDIMRLYAARRGQFYHNGREFRFWETNDKRKLTARQLAERERQLAEIDKEIPAVLRELLGMNYEREVNRLFVDTNEDERRLAFLPEEKRVRVASLREEIETRREKILRAFPNGKLTPAGLEQMREVDEFEQQALAGLLSKEEVELYELATSETSERLRSELIGFDPNKEEFRGIYDLERAFDKEFAFADLDDETVRRARELERARIDAEIKLRLGDSRYAEYQRARNPDFQNACVFAQTHELPAATAETLFELKQIVEQERQRLFSKSVPQENRAEALKAVRDETEKALRDLLGDTLYSSYSKDAGKWVESLTN